jgi:manganese/zinc/iron transport system substrate-binding protein
MKKGISLLLLITMSFSIISGCTKVTEESSGSSDGYQIVATTTMLADLTKILGGENVEVEGLMGPGIDPHLYKASAGDVELMQNADMIVYSGLHLEGKMADIFENLEGMDKLVVEGSEDIDESKLLSSEDDESLHDPHIWFDVSLWKEVAKNVVDGLKELDSDNSDKYEENYENYLSELDELDTYITDRVTEVPEESRVLITAHDAFAYFGEAYGFEVKGIQGISTASEAGTSDISNLADFIVEREIKSIFVESSVSQKNIEALQEAVQNKGFEVSIGGELYSDSLGSEDSDTETYIGTFKANIDTIVDALK